MSKQSYSVDDNPIVLFRSSASWEEQARSLTPCKVALKKCDIHSINAAHNSEDNVSLDAASVVSMATTLSDRDESIIPPTLEPEFISVPKESVASPTANGGSYVDIFKQFLAREPSPIPEITSSSSAQSPTEDIESRKDPDADSLRDLETVDQGRPVVKPRDGESNASTIIGEGETVGNALVNDISEDVSEIASEVASVISHGSRELPYQPEDDSNEAGKDSKEKEQKADNEKPKRGRGRQKKRETGNANIFELLRQQNDKIQEKVHGKVLDVSPKRKSPIEKKSPTEKKAPSPVEKMQTPVKRGRGRPAKKPKAVIEQVEIPKPTKDIGDTETTLTERRSAREAKKKAEEKLSADARARSVSSEKEQGPVQRDKEESGSFKKMLQTKPSPGKSNRKYSLQNMETVYDDKRLPLPDRMENDVRPTENVHQITEPEKIAGKKAAKKKGKRDVPARGTFPETTQQHTDSVEKLSASKSQIIDVIERVVSADRKKKDSKKGFLQKRKVQESAKQIGQDNEANKEDIPDEYPGEKCSEDNEEMSELLFLATARTLRSETQKTPPQKSPRDLASPIELASPTTPRQEAQAFERALQLSLLESAPPGGEKISEGEKLKKKKKKHKKDKKKSKEYKIIVKPDGTKVKVKKKKKKKLRPEKMEKPPQKENSESFELDESQIALLEESFECLVPELLNQFSNKPKTVSEKSTKSDTSPRQEISDTLPEKKIDKKTEKGLDKKAKDKFKSPQEKGKHSPIKSTEPLPDKSKTDTKQDSLNKNKKDTVPKSPKGAKDKTKKKSSPRDKSPRSQIQESLEISEADYVPERALRSRATDKKTKESDKEKSQQRPQTEREPENSAKAVTHESGVRAPRAKEKVTSPGPEDWVHNSKYGESSHRKESDRHHHTHDKYDKHHKRPRSENLFLQDISQAPKGFEHDLPLSPFSALAPHPSTTPIAPLAPIAPVEFPTLIDSAHRKRKLDSLAQEFPNRGPLPNSSVGMAADNNMVLDSPPQKRKRGRPPKASKQNAAPTMPVISKELTPMSPSTLSPRFNTGATNAFGLFGVPGPSAGPSIGPGPNVGAEPAQPKSKRGRKRKRNNSGRVELHDEGIVYTEDGSQEQESDVRIKQELNSEESNTWTEHNSEEEEEGREVVMVSVATMTDSSYLQDMARLQAEQAAAEAAAELAAQEEAQQVGIATVVGGRYSPRLMVKLYSCDYCTRVFTQRSWMVLHKLREHGYSCQSQAIYMHTLARRTIKRNLTQWRRYGCDTCCRRFNHRAHLNWHKQCVHTRKRYR